MTWEINNCQFAPNAFAVAPIIPPSSAAAVVAAKIKYSVIISKEIKGCSRSCTHQELLLHEEDGEEHDTFCEGSAQNRLNEDLRRCARIAADRFRSSHTDQTYTDRSACGGCGHVYVTGNFS